MTRQEIIDDICNADQRAVNAKMGFDATMAFPLEMIKLLEIQDD